MHVPSPKFQIQLRFVTALGSDQESAYVRSEGKVIHGLSNVFTDDDRNENLSLAIRAHESLLETEGLKASSSDQSNNWTVSPDEHLEERQCREYAWVGLKLTSPVYRNETPQDKQRIIDQVHRVVEMLDTETTPIAIADARLEIIIRPSKDEFSLDQLKGIASLFWVLDPLLSEIQPPHCDPGSLPSLGLQFTNLARNKRLLDLKAELDLGVQIEDPWNNRLSPDRKPLKLLRHPGEMKMGKYRHGLEMIHEAGSISDLSDLLGFSILNQDAFPQIQPAYDFRAANQPDTPFIKINKHCGTLDEPSILNWVDVCTHVTGLGLDLPAPALYAASRRLRHRVSNGLTFVEFLKSQNLISPAALYVKRSESENRLDVIPELKAWPLRRKAVPDDESEPLVGTHSSSLDDFRLRALNWDNSSKDASRSTYSFGIELEFYHPVADKNGDDIIDPDPEDSRPLLQRGMFRDEAMDIAQRLKSLGHPVMVFYHDPNDGDLKRAFAEHGLFPVDGIVLKYQKWSIEPDGSLPTITEDIGDYYNLVGKEMVSPVLRDMPRSWEQVLDLIRDLRDNLRTTIVKACGFHIHVAKGTQPLPLHLLRKVACLTFCVDDILFKLVDPQRDRNWAYPVSKPESFLRQSYKESWNDITVQADFEHYIPTTRMKGHELLGILKWLWSAPTLEQLKERWSQGDKICAAFHTCKDLQPSCGGINTHTEGTVEFRQLEGTLDPGLVLRWSQLIMSLFQFADLASPDAWRTLIMTALQFPDPADPTSCFKSFLEQLGLGEDHEYWVNRVQAFKKLLKNASNKEDETINEVEPPPRVWGEEEDDVNNNRLFPPTPEGENFSRYNPMSRMSVEDVENLRKHVCQRQRKPPYLTEKEPAVGTENEKFEANLHKRVKALLAKIGLTDPLIDEALKLAISAESKEPSKTNESGPRNSTQSEAESPLLKMLQAKRNQARKEVESYYAAMLDRKGVS
ncbi:hypothetical protein NM208_g7218 [Fusarium decemcellulare]|uniref:Uncharacterized protein n=1 Tax=Fusarium decemcellulare TaxID=57161 RepID=A0ACC1SA80_9HYPO|nr:hypothetical protein NM208_g7218 [Fusarium decemcellulare]